MAAAVGAAESDGAGIICEERRESGEDGRRQRRNALFRYGQLRMRYVLQRRLGEAGELGPRDTLIVQPTSIGTGMDAKFMEVCMGTPRS